MKMVRMPIAFTLAQKKFLDELRRSGTTASGYIRSLLERELKPKKGD